MTGPTEINRIIAKVHAESGVLFEGRTLTDRSRLELAAAQAHHRLSGEPLADCLRFVQRVGVDQAIAFLPGGLFSGIKLTRGRPIIEIAESIYRDVRHWARLHGPHPFFRKRSRRMAGK